MYVLMYCMYVRMYCMYTANFHSSSSQTCTATATLTSLTHTPCYLGIGLSCMGAYLRQSVWPRAEFAGSPCCDVVDNHTVILALHTLQKNQLNSSMHSTQCTDYA